MEQTWLPHINAQLCIGCKHCLNACPTQALEQVGGKAVLTRPDRCIYCSACEAICPTFAIEIPFLIMFDETSGDESEDDA